MYIRKDLLNKIKKVFNIKKFTYVGTEKHFYNDNDMFIFDCGNKNIAIEVETANFFYIYMCIKPKKVLIILVILTQLRQEISYL